jgi:hypothetical protein
MERDIDYTSCSRIQGPRSFISDADFGGDESNFIFST